MKIAEIMTPNPEFVTPDDGVIEVAQLMARANVGLVPVCESRETRTLIGCITDRDVVVRVVAEGRDPHTVANLREIMSHELVTCAPNDDVESAVTLMEEHQVRRILVTDEHGSLAGVVALADLATKLGREKTGEAVEEICRDEPSA
jgi:CBS domain-containing protein